MLKAVTFIIAEMSHCSRLQLGTDRKQQHADCTLFLGEWFLVCSSQCYELCNLEYLSSITWKCICAALEFADASREPEGQNQQAVV